MSAAHVLAVDDNATIRRAISLRLGARGYRVTTAEHGEEALEQLAREPFDLVLLDLQMPGMNGRDVLRNLRNRFDQTELPVIVLSASDDQAAIQDTLDLGANDYVVKPGDLPVLLARIKTQLSLKQTTARLREKDLLSGHAWPGAASGVPATNAACPAVAEQGSGTGTGAVAAADTGGTNVTRLLTPDAGPAADTPCSDICASPEDTTSGPLPVDARENIGESTVVPLGLQQRARISMPMDTEMSRDFLARVESTTRWGSEQVGTSKGFVSDLDYRVWYDNTPTLSLTINPEGEIISVNRFGAEFFGFKPTELVGQPIFSLYAEDAVDEASEFLDNVCRNPGRPLRWEVRRRRRSGALLWVRETARAIEDLTGAMHILVNCEDIDETYRLSEKLTHQSLHDDLTGLANRKALEERLTTVLESATREGTRHVLAYFDLDQFRVVNDTLGHAAGDALIREMARVLSARVRRRDTLARMGGDEFALLLEDCELAEGLEILSGLRDDVANHLFEWRGQAYQTTLSAGLTAIDEQAPSVEELLSMVDTACYAAKDAGRNRLHVFEPDDEVVAQRHGEMRWANRVGDALREDRFELNYQPIRPVREDPAHGDHYEVLVRMRDAAGGIVSPGLFLPAAERYNLAGKLDRWVIANTLGWLQAHPAAMGRLGVCSVNLSGQSMGDPAMLAFIQAELRASSVPPEHICFEITETAAIANLGAAIRFIAELKGIGCRFALDDFGSGFSSFAYLKNLPVDYLKIDGAFVRDIARDSINHAMVRSINEVGHVMGKQTIAEFVEDEATLSVLREMGVDFVQGYGIGRPAPMDDMVPTDAGS